MLLHENAEQALKFVLRGGVDGLTPGASLTGLLRDVSLTSLFSGWLTSPQDHDGTVSWTANKGKRTNIDHLVGYPPPPTHTHTHTHTFLEELLASYRNELRATSDLIVSHLHPSLSTTLRTSDGLLHLFVFFLLLFLS